MTPPKIDPAAWNDGRSFIQGEVYLASDKYVSESLKTAFGLDVKKERPVLILQNDRLNAVPQMPVILVAPITSQKRVFENDYALQADGTLLHYDSIVQLSLVHAIPKRALVKRLGKLKEAELHAVKDRLRRKFAL
ncbi:MAG: type II toxin-antitoxin system PemK/MazF family toxin [Candidatus Rokubacteria bacterium]|nr:type II toxin-antitoxin system PemK/MazF family toxin [Candidatus Rokubacteria bacterium]